MQIQRAAARLEHSACAGWPRPTGSRRTTRRTGSRGWYRSSRASGQSRPPRCSGTPGSTGPQGPAGSQGASGTPVSIGLQGDPGLHCWDLNGSGTTDPEEDVNGDGLVNVLDCQGPEGPAPDLSLLIDKIDELEARIVALELTATSTAAATTTTPTLRDTILNILSPDSEEAVILPLDDEPTFPTLGSQVFTFVWNSTPTFGTSGSVPPVDGSPATTASHPFWSAGADGTGASEPSFSLGAWINPVDDANNKAILTRIDMTTGDVKGEWQFLLGGSEKLRFNLFDNSVTSSRIGQAAESGMSVDQWHFVVATYDGTASSVGVTLYVDGSPTASTPDEFSSYVAMENLALPTMVALSLDSSGSPTQLFNGDMAGGPLGSFFVPRMLNGNEILALHNAGLSALNSP